MPNIMQSIKKHCNNLKSVNLSRNKLASKGIIILFDRLSEIGGVRIVDISQNDISDDCMESIANFIKHSPHTGLKINLGGFYDSTLYLYSEETFRRLTKSKNVTNKSIEILHSVLIGNISVEVINLNYQVGITDESVGLLKEIAEQSGASLLLSDVSVTKENQDELRKLFSIAVDERVIPVVSSSKSASKRAN